jgi:anti-anti-sigma regulatory factor
MRITQDGNIVRIAGTLGLSEADELHKALAGSLNRHSGLMLDLSSVDACDASGLQLLYAARRSALIAKKPFRIVAISPEFEQACITLGTSVDMLRGEDAV